MAKKLSFIIPVYNVEDYLEECLDSILLQATDECELILIDDGSTDSSGKICDEYAREHDIVSAIHKDNAGPSAARNYGIERAKGAFLCFVDSDDRISQGAISRILDWTNNGSADICFLEAVKFFPDGRKVALGDDIQVESVRGKSKLEVMQHLRTRPKFPGSPCTKLYRTSFLLKNNIAFPCDNRHAEDLGFVQECILNAKSFDALSFPYYEYRQGITGSRSSASEKSFFGMAMFVQESVEKLSKDKQAKDEICRCAMSFVAYEYSIMLWKYFSLNSSAKEKAFHFLKDYRWVLQYGASKKTQAIHSIACILGLKITSALINMYMNLTGA